MNKYVKIQLTLALINLPFAAMGYALNIFVVGVCLYFAVLSYDRGD